MASVSLPSSSCSHHSFLACYPTVNSDNTQKFLLANVPLQHLKENELEQRLTYGYHRPSMVAPTNDHERQIFFMSRLWNIEKDILEFNFKKFLTLHQQMAIYRMQHFNTRRHQEYLHEDEHASALEFFLQFDMNLFYMKTCSYRQAEPVRDIPRGIFCGQLEPQARYALMPCHQLSCCLCHPSYKFNGHQEYDPIIRFGPQQEHYFINGYRSILNCPASCTTRNIIYVLTCPCKKVDYIGETSLCLAERLIYHQRHGNRILQEFLLGSKHMARIQNKLKSFEAMVQGRMKLYQHSTVCSLAMQRFLDENPEYWPFVPEKINEQDELADEREIMNTTNDGNEFIYANDVPEPPKGFRFRREQKEAIDHFFQQEKYLDSPNLHLDLYYTTIIAILPDYTSDILRRWIEALFITHAETKLNTIGHLDQMTTSSSLFSDNADNHKKISSMNNIPWCENLLRRPYPYNS